jgi:hypothetical protein
MNRINRIGKRKLKNGCEHEAGLPQESAFAKSHPVNPVHPVQNVFWVAARRAAFICGKKLVGMALASVDEGWRWVGGAGFRPSLFQSLDAVPVVVLILISTVGGPASVLTIDTF